MLALPQAHAELCYREQDLADCAVTTAQTVASELLSSGPVSQPDVNPSAGITDWTCKGLQSTEVITVTGSTGVNVGPISFGASVTKTLADKTYYNWSCTVGWTVRTVGWDGNFRNVYAEAFYSGEWNKESSCTYQTAATTGTTCTTADSPRKYQSFSGSGQSDGTTKVPIQAHVCAETDLVRGLSDPQLGAVDIYGPVSKHPSADVCFDPTIDWKDVSAGQVLKDILGR